MKAAWRPQQLVYVTIESAVVEAASEYFAANTLLQLPKKEILEDQEELADHFTSANIELDSDKTNYQNHVCVGCENRANRAFWITIFFILLIPVMAALPAIIMYGGNKNEDY